jgi:hypothetical protein
MFVIIFYLASHFSLLQGCPVFAAFLEQKDFNTVGIAAGNCYRIRSYKVYNNRHSYYIYNHFSFSVFINALLTDTGKRAAFFSDAY